MPNLTLSVSEELQEKMRRHPEIRWSEVARKSISEKIEDLDAIEKLAKKAGSRPRMRKASSSA
ncbi:MAG TPA: hypothetical protein VI979_00685 [archaeon]|nr:hypothetical protein [archaeon]